MCYLFKKKRKKLYKDPHPVPIACGLPSDVLHKLKSVVKAVFSFEAAPLCVTSLPDIPHALTSSALPLSPLLMNTCSDFLLHPRSHPHLGERSCESSLSASEEGLTPVCKQACIAARMPAIWMRARGVFFSSHYHFKHSSQLSIERSLHGINCYFMKC